LGAESGVLVGIPPVDWGHGHRTHF
jgi:hypothetical protein